MLSMEYQSTRGGETASAARAIVQGIAKDGGLFVPTQLPKVDRAWIEQLVPLSYQARALHVLAPFLPEFSESELRGLIAGAYEDGFDAEAVAPVRKVRDGLFMLELWHGPTLAFKDMALQLMPHLLTASRGKVGERREILILVATSGDTGKAALDGFCDVPGTKIAVFYPKDGVSQAQQLQMVTQAGDNTRVIAVDGNFDDAQTGVKRIFADAQFAQMLDARGMVLSSANSINLGRLLPQIVYYFSAYADMRAQGAIAAGDAIDVSVPTGNFGNILAATYAKRMGLPIGKLICASNSNNVLTDFIETGTYDANRAFHLTTSPSMDILISSNLERMLHQLLDGDAERVKEMMKSLGDEGNYKLPDAAMEKLREVMAGGWASESMVRAQIKRRFEADHYLLDPHTAVADCVLEQWQQAHGGGRPALVVSTASPYKFGRSVLESITEASAAGDDFACCERLAQLVGQSVPLSISELPNKPVRHHAQCAVDGMPDELLAQLFGRG